MRTPAIQKFIREHLNDDLPRLLLSAHRYPGVPVSLAVAQIEALRKVRLKIPSWYRFDLIFPPLLSTEQASSEQTARFKAGLFSGNRMADLTGGMGIDAYFFAQHFGQVSYLDKNPDLVALARHNFDVLGVENINANTGEAESFLKETADTFDLLYLDPARRDTQQRRIFRLEDCQPNVPALLPLLFTKAPKLLLKTAPLLDLKAAVEQLGVVTRIWVVSVDNEVKEVLYLLEQTAVPFEAIQIEAACLGERGQVFAFTRAEEQAALVVYSDTQRYLYEPDAAILKAGAFKAFARRFGLAKLHPNTHLYTSETRVDAVPGRTFQVEAVVRYDRKSILEAVPEGKANVAVRNFPDPVEAVRKKLGLKDGGTIYLFAATDFRGQKQIIVCRPTSS